MNTSTHTYMPKREKTILCIRRRMLHFKEIFIKFCPQISHLVTESNFELQEIEDDDNIDENKLLKDRERERDVEP